MNISSSVLRLHPPIKGKTIPLVVDSPHSGGILPPDFEFTCSLDDLRHAEDSYIDQFARNIPQLGGTFLQALVNRAYIDLNRAIGDLHPDVCSETIPWPLNRSRRVNFGMGLIRHLIRANEPVYAAPLTLAQIQHRIATVYEPYYDALGKALAESKERFGRVLHINLHAMPSISFDSSPEPDIVIGDHDGHSAARPYREWLKQAFERRGLKVVINHPYKGVELTRRFAKPRQGFHSLQLEVNKALYMDEATLAFHDGKNDLQMLFDDVWRDLADWLTPDEMRHAAE